jgi:uncharacterized Fe-S center protein
MKSKVYYVKTDNGDDAQTVKERFSLLLAKSGILGCISAKESGVIKIHFGEEGNTGYVKPEYVGVLTKAVREKGANVVLADTNTLYKGRRMESAEHTRLALEHGFTPEVAGAEVVIPNEKAEGQTAKLEINQKFIKTAKVLKLFIDADFLINVAHFKGHMMTGYGGVLKNIGMGCASREGKLEQHTDISPVVYMETCIGCGKCVEICPADAITLREKKATVDNGKCIGCANCIAVCPTEAITVPWDSGGDTIQEKMVEYAKAVLDRQKGRALHISFALKITKECDCLAKDDPRIAPDVGILASLDPVSLDKACLDLTINACDKDVLKEVHPRRNGMKQLEHAREIGLGRLDYELIEIT